MQVLVHICTDRLWKSHIISLRSYCMLPQMVSIHLSHPIDLYIKIYRWSSISSLLLSCQNSLSYPDGLLILSSYGIQSSMHEITYTGTGERVDTRLVSQFSYSRSFFHHILTRGGVQVAGRIIKKSYKLKSGDIVHIDDISRYLDAAVLDEAPMIDIPVMLETDDYLIIDKPKWVLSHPNSVWDVKQPSVVGFLYHRYKNLPSIGSFIRAGLLHRLDKGTDGFMIIAKSERGLAHFKHLFQEKSTAKKLADKEAVSLKKFYRAVVSITPAGQEFLNSIELPHYIQELVHAKVPYYVPKIGISKIVGVSEQGETAIVNLEILTWRTHQIRYHLSNHGLPILGDTVYGYVGPDTEIQLTAVKLVFADLDGKIQTIQKD